MRRPKTKIAIEQYSDGFSIAIIDTVYDNERKMSIRTLRNSFKFDQEDTVEKLKVLFLTLGFEDVTLEEVC